MLNSNFKTNWNQEEEEELIIQILRIKLEKKGSYQQQPIEEVHQSEEEEGSFQDLKETNNIIYML